MKILNIYSKLRAAVAAGKTGYSLYSDDPELIPWKALFRSWEMDVESSREWFESPEGIRQEAGARQYLGEVAGILTKVETIFEQKLPGVLILAPSYGEFDGFARYADGEHTVLLGIDFPDADVDYLKALTAHELSHVYRDHAPHVWAHLGKPLKEVSRSDYLQASTAQEHLVSEGLATLFSQMVYPEIPPVVHHYYTEEEWNWCELNADKIHKSLMDCLKSHGDVWSYYSRSRVSSGSPSRTQYYWAAKMLAQRLQQSGDDPLKTVVELHKLPAASFSEFS